MKLALVVMGAALVAGSVAGAQAREVASLPPIVFSSGQLDRDLLVMRADGSHRRVLTPVGRDDSDPSWSRDGLRIAFSFYNGRRERVAVLELGTGRVRDLGDGFNPDWSPDGRRLVFLDAEGFGDLLVMDARGTNRHRLGLAGSGIEDETDPSWSPDGQKIAFVGDGLWVVHAASRVLCRRFFLLWQDLLLELGRNFRLRSKSSGGCVGMSFEHFGAFSSTLGRW